MLALTVYWQFAKLRQLAYGVFLDGLTLTKTRRINILLSQNSNEFLEGMYDTPFHL